MEERLVIGEEISGSANGGATDFSLCTHILVSNVRKGQTPSIQPVLKSKMNSLILIQ